MNPQPYGPVDLARMLIRDARSELKAGSHLSAEVDAELAACQRRLDEPLRVALAGTLKSGKSTLLNALVGEEIAPTDATECTRVVTWYEDGHAPAVMLYPPSGAPRPLRIARDEGALQIDLGVPADAVDRLVVTWPSASLRA